MRSCPANEKRKQNAVKEYPVLFHSQLHCLGDRQTHVYITISNLCGADCVRISRIIFYLANSDCFPDVRGCESTFNQGFKH